MLSSIHAFLLQLTTDQISQLSVLVLVVVQAIKIVYMGLLKQPKPSVGQLRLFVFVISVPLGYFYSGIKLPALTDPLALAQAIFALGTQVLVVSGLVYEYVLQGLAQFLDNQVLGRRGKTPVLAP